MERNSYGEIIPPRSTWITGGKTENPYDRDLYLEARCLVNCAAKRKKIPAAYNYIEFDKKSRASGFAMHHEVYDISEDGRHVLLCVRETEGTRYGVKTTSKTYYIVSAHGSGTRVQEANKAKAAKAAKQAGDNVYGFAIACCLGKKKLTMTAPKKMQCFKIVAKIDDSFASVFDDSEWMIGKTRRERSSMNHESGYYVFPTVETAMEAWNDRIAFADEWMTADQYALLECECYGRYYVFDNNKICITAVKPIKEIAVFV